MSVPNVTMQSAHQSIRLALVLLSHSSEFALNNFSFYFDQLPPKWFCVWPICSYTHCHRSQSHFPWLLLIIGGSLYLSATFRLLHSPDEFMCHSIVRVVLFFFFFFLLFCPQYLIYQPLNVSPQQYLLLLLLCCNASLSQFLLSSWLHPLDICSLLCFRCISGWAVILHLI